jgi:hypothetical protein
VHHGLRRHPGCHPGDRAAVESVRRDDRRARRQGRGGPVEIFFSVIQKKAISPNDFHSREDLSGTLLTFIERYNRTAKPFNWKYTADDLRGLLRRISEHEKEDAKRQSGLTAAA